jgi:hypothetical protein
MRFQWTESFGRDWRGLSKRHKSLFLESFPAFSDACDSWVNKRTPFPSRFRVDDVKAALGVLEMTWSFSGPDGRATWQWSSVSIEGQDYPAVLWRRIGLHEIYKNP